MRELSLHILDIVQNSLSAGASQIKIGVYERRHEDTLRITIEDNGRGMTPEQIEKVLDPFYTTRTTRKVGMGLSLLQANAQMCGGDLSIASVAGQGTQVKVEFQLNHIDRQPMGDIIFTLVTLVAGAPQVDFIFEHTQDALGYVFDTAEIRVILEGMSLHHPEVLDWIKGFLTEKEGMFPESTRI